MKICQFALALGIGGAAWGQVSGNPSLNGKYYFRQVLLITDGTASVTDTRTGWGTITFDGKGNFTVSGQELIGTAVPVALSGNGTYTVKPGGMTTLSNPLRAGATVNARLGAGALVGSSTEAGPTVFDLLIAIPAPAQAVSNSALNGAYWISTLEFPSGGTTDIRDTNFRLTAHGTGSFDENKIIGQAANLGNALQTQTAIGAITYAISPDGTGALNFPAGDAAALLVAGVKNVYISQDGTYLIGGSTAAGGHGLVVGVQAFTSNATNANWSGFYFAAGLRYDVKTPAAPARLAAVSGAVHATGDGNTIWARRTRQSDGLYDAAPLITYNLTGDGSGPLTSSTGHVTLASTGSTFATTGVDVVSSSSYEIYFGAMMPPQSGSGVFLHPQGVFNAANYAPLGYPVSPGAFLALNGSGFGNQSFIAKALPFPFMTPTGVSVTVNHLPAPVYSVSSSPVPQITAIVPYSVTGSTATIVVTVNGVQSNAVDVPLAATSPGIFTLAQSGLGDAAIRRPDGSLVSSMSPAERGSFVAIYISGLGTVNPPVGDGVAAPGQEPLARITEGVNVYIGGQLASTPEFAGLTPTLAGLYQLNIQVPVNVTSGLQSLALQTAEGFTDMANIAVQ